MYLSAIHFLISVTTLISMGYGMMSDYLKQLRLFSLRDLSTKKIGWKAPSEPENTVEDELHMWIKKSRHIKKNMLQLYYNICPIEVVARGILTTSKNHVVPGWTAETHSKWLGDHSVIFIGDPQYGFNHDNEDFLFEQVNFIAAAKKISSNENPKLIVFCGDLAHDFPRNKKPNRRNEQIRAWLLDCSKYLPDVPLFVMPGNHDLNNHTSYTALRSYSEIFGDHYYSFWAYGVFYIVTNSTLLFDHEQFPEEANMMIKWVEETLAEASQHKPKHIFMFGHYPLYNYNYDEPDNIGNRYYDVFTYLYPESEGCIPVKVRLQLVQLMEKYNVKYYFAGHLHAHSVKRNEIFTQFTLTSVSTDQDIASRAGYYSVQVRDANIEVNLKSTAVTKELSIEYASTADVEQDDSCWDSRDN